MWIAIMVSIRFVCILWEYVKLNAVNIVHIRILLVLNMDINSSIIELSL